eukprot:EG_transcript_15114
MPFTTVKNALQTVVQLVLAKPAIMVAIQNLLHPIANSVDIVLIPLALEVSQHILANFVNSLVVLGALQDPAVVAVVLTEELRDVIVHALLLINVLEQPLGGVLSSSFGILSKSHEKK